MDEAEPHDLTMEAADFRERARVARLEAAAPGLEPWRVVLLTQSADYYERRANDAQDRLLLTSSVTDESLRLDRLDEQPFYEAG